MSIMLPDSSESIGLAEHGRDLGMLATMDHAEFHHAGDFLAEAHATRAVDAARHLGHRDQRADVLLEDDALFLVVARFGCAIADRQILQLAFAALIADRAVERMVDQQELHHALLRLQRLLAARANDHALRWPASRRPASASAPSRPRPDTSGSWPRSTASCDSRNAGCRCRRGRQHASRCCLRPLRPSCRRVRFQSCVQPHAAPADP